MLTRSRQYGAITNRDYYSTARQNHATNQKATEKLTLLPNRLQRCGNRIVSSCGYLPSYNQKRATSKLIAVNLKVSEKCHQSPEMQKKSDARLQSLDIGIHYRTTCPNPVSPGEAVKLSLVHTSAVAY